MGAYPLGRRLMNGSISYGQKINEWEHILSVADPGFGKGGFMRMFTVATTPPFDAHVHRCNDAVCSQNL